MVRSLWPNSCMVEPLHRLDKILLCFLARLYLDQILSGTLGVNLGKILANKNLARQSWLFIQDKLARSWEIFLVG